VGPRAGLDARKDNKSLAPNQNRTPATQSVASRYTDCTIPTKNILKKRYSKKLRNTEEVSGHGLFKGTIPGSVPKGAGPRDLPDTNRNSETFGCQHHLNAFSVFGGASASRAICAYM
jgi:hypothetical protein